MEPASVRRPLPSASFPTAQTAPAPNPACRSSPASAPLTPRRWLIRRAPANWSPSSASDEDPSRMKPALLALTALAPLLAAQDGALGYKQSCASCHDGGNDRAPGRDALRGMTPERVLAAMESGPMISMASRLKAPDRRAVAEYVTGKSFSRPLETAPPARAMCRAAAPAFALSGPAWNGWGVNTGNARFQDASAAGLPADQVPRLKVKWAFGFPGDIQAYGHPAV